MVFSGDLLGANISSTSAHLVYLSFILSLGMNCLVVLEFIEYIISAAYGPHVSGFIGTTLDFLGRSSIDYSIFSSPVSLLILLFDFQKEPWEPRAQEVYSTFTDPEKLKEDAEFHSLKAKC